MSADLVAFVDSNVLVYAVSKDEPEKQERAQMIVGRGFADTETRFHVRVITTPTDAKRLLALLASSVDAYEREFGRLPEQPDR